MTATIQPRLLLGLLMALCLTGCDFYAATPSCLDYFKPGDRSGFDTDDKGMAIQDATGTQWYWCAAGQRFAASRCQGEPVQLNLDDAMAYAAELAEKSGKPWRIASNDEMASIQQTACQEPSVNPNVFKGIEVNNYWTSNTTWSHDSLRCSAYLLSGTMYCRQARSTELPFLLVLDKAP